MLAVPVLAYAIGRFNDRPLVDRERIWCAALAAAPASRARIGNCPAVDTPGCPRPGALPRVKGFVNLDSFERREMKRPSSSALGPLGSDQARFQATPSASQAKSSARRNFSGIGC
jgi:hypothetical protein